MASAEHRLSRVAWDLSGDPDNPVLVSAATAWEIGVKHTRARHGLDPLPIDEGDTFELARLPPLHQHPFDHMLICQAIARQAVIVTPDPLIG